MVLTSPSQPLTEDEKKQIEAFLETCREKHWDRLEKLMVEWRDKEQYISLRAMLIAFKQTTDRGDNQQ